MVSLPDLLQRESARRDRPSASIVFDDGFASIRDDAVPLLVQRRVPFAVFVNPQAVREDRLTYVPPFPDGSRRRPGRNYLNDRDLRFLADQGVTFGNHSMTHASLAGLSDADLDREIRQSKDQLEELVGSGISYFGLPYGKKVHYDERALDACFDSGHSVVLSSNPTSFGAENLRGQRPLVPRIGITNQTTADLTFLINRPLFKRVDL